MKSTSLIIALLISFTSMAQTGVQFDKSSYNYGKIKQGVNKSVIFSYANNDAKPAVIEFANAECGCTQPEYNQKPILKGQKGTIKITYTAPTVGAFKKKVTVKFAGVKVPTELTIEGEVI